MEPSVIEAGGIDGFTGVFAAELLMAASLEKPMYHLCKVESKFSDKEETSRHV